MKIKELLTEYFILSNDLDGNMECKIEYIDAKELLVPNRLDLICKLKYIEAKETKKNVKFAKKLYKKHIEAFSAGTYCEPGNKEKNSIQSYFEQFDILIEDIKKCGIDEKISVIPIGKNNTILDGAHRTAIAIYYELKVPIIRFDKLEFNADASSFKKALLEEKYIDYMICEYVKKKEKCYIACFWNKKYNPQKMKYAIRLLKEESTIVYQKKIKMSYDGLKNLMIQVYSNQAWIGNAKNHYRGIDDKVQACLGELGLLDIVLFEGVDLEKVRILKNKIRKLYGIGNSSIHITDTMEECIELSKIVFHQNTIDFLNQAQPTFDIHLIERIEMFKSNIKKNNLNVENFVVDSSSIMGLYGLRKVGDLDFMSIDPNYKLVESDNCNNNHHHIVNYAKEIDELVLNPENYLVFAGLKFVTLPVLQIFKENRDEKKDREDVKLIRSVLQNNGRRLKFLKLVSFIRRKRRFFIAMMKKGLLFVLKKMGVYKKIYPFYKQIKGRKNEL